MQVKTPGVVHAHQEVSLARLELFLVDLPQKSTFVSGIGARKSKQTLIVEWIDADGFAGYGECSCRPDPYYSHEFIPASVALLRQFVVPALKHKQTFGDLYALLNRVRGWQFTKTAVEAAAFNALRQNNGFNWPAETGIQALEKVPVGISMGMYADPGACHAEVQQALNAGYRRIKFKISPDSDIRVFEKINPLLFDSGVHIGFDANGSFSADRLEKLQYFVQTYQTPIEQPFAPGRFDHFLTAKQAIPNLRVCWDEEVTGLGDLVKLHHLGAVDELNLKIGRVGGIAGSLEIIDYCRRHGIPCWIGGMFETGVGRLLNLEMAALLPQAKGHDLSPSARYFEEDIVEPEIVMDHGWMSVDQSRTCRVIPELLEKYTLEKITCKPAG